MKRLVILGDSIAAGTYTAEGDWCPLHKAKTFGEIIGERLGFDETVNLAVNGIPYSRLNREREENCVIEQEKRAPECSVLIISAGTNDFGTNVPPGEADCEKAGEEERNGNTFCGATEIVFSEIARKRKNTRVVIVTPYNRAQETNEIGHTLGEYRKILEEKAKKYGFLLVKGEEIRLTKKELFDGLHPDNAGHKLIAERLIKELSE